MRTDEVSSSLFLLLEEAGNSTSLSLPLQVEYLLDYQITRLQ